MVPQPHGLGDLGGLGVDLTRALLKFCVGSGEVTQVLQASQKFMRAMISRLTKMS